MTDSRSIVPSAFVRWTASLAAVLTAVNIAADLVRAPLREALTPGLAMHVGLLATMASLLVRSRRLKAALAVLGLVVVSAAFLLNRVR
jgi:hypothetical protein